MDSRDFILTCPDGEYHFPKDYLRGISQAIDDFISETDGDTFYMPFPKSRVDLLFILTSKLDISLETKERWLYLFMVADYIQLTPPYEKHLVTAFMKWYRRQGVILETLDLDFYDCKSKLEGPTYLSPKERLIKNHRKIREIYGIRRLYPDTDCWVFNEGFHKTTSRVYRSFIAGNLKDPSIKSLVAIKPNILKYTYVSMIAANHSISQELMNNVGLLLPIQEEIIRDISALA